MDKVGETGSLNLSWDEIGFICHAMAMAPRQLRRVSKTITEEYSLGPRGAWMLGLIAKGSVFPLDLTHMFQVGRSLITAELNRLTEAGLITSRKSADDGRRLELALTPKGEAANIRLAEELAMLLGERLSSYTREEILFCARMLRDFSGSERPNP